jgi:hypothetical protein
VFALSKEAEAKKTLDRNFKAILEQRGNEQE